MTGVGNYYRWDKVVLEAHPFDNFNFAGWSGDLNSIDAKIEFEAIHDINLEASFIAVPQVNGSAQDTFENLKLILDKWTTSREAKIHC